MMLLPRMLLHRPSWRRIDCQRQVVVESSCFHIGSGQWSLLINASQSCDVKEHPELRWWCKWESCRRHGKLSRELNSLQEIRLLSML